MGAELRRKIKSWVVVIVGLTGFSVQSLQYFTGRWSNPWYIEVFILVLFLGIALQPLKIIKAFIEKVTNNNQNRMTEELKEEYKEELQDDGLTGGELPDEDEEV